MNRQHLTSLNFDNDGIKADVSRLNKMEETVSRYLKFLDLPDWYRGLSKFQIGASFELGDALRDDMQQKSIHRTLGLLLRLGMRPLVLEQQIRTLIYMSRGSDIAFLWFLMELCYKQKDHTNGYNVNEQIIMSLIMHLDLFPTLRELDRILPSRYMSREYQEKRAKRKRQEKKLLIKKQLSVQKPKIEYLLPYFEPPLIPKAYGKPLTCDYPPRISTIQDYLLRRQNCYKQRITEQSRWFAAYQLSTGKRIVYCILHNEIKKIFKDLKLAKVTGKTVKSLCEHHKAINELEQSLADKLKVIARQRCEKIINVMGKKQQERKCRIVKQLEQDVACFRKQFQQMAKRSRLQVTRHTLCAESSLLQLESDNEDDSYAQGKAFHICDSCDVLGQNCNLHDSASHHTDAKGGIYLDSDSGLGSSSCSGCKRVGSKFTSKTSISAFGKRYMSSTCMHQSKPDTSEQLDNGLSTPSMRKIHFRDRNKRKLKQADSMNLSEQSLGVTPTDVSTNNMTSNPCILKMESQIDQSESELCFKTSNLGTPYEFDYRTIFQTKRNDDQQISLKKEFIKAVDSDVELINKLITGHEPIMDEAVSKCTKKLFNVSQKLFKSEYRRAERRFYSKKKTPLSFHQKSYDGNDKKLMDSMLREALEYIAKDRRFVLASMPQVYKAPVLREWIYERYGKKYSQQERIEEYSASKKFHSALLTISMRTAMPTISAKLDNPQLINYTCRDYLVKMLKKIRKDFYTQVNKTVMEFSRLFYFAIRPLLSDPPPGNTFFAYMPSHPGQIKHFRVWQKNEYMDAHTAWRKRQRAKRE